jgi:hypothetical protein
MRQEGNIVSIKIEENKWRDYVKKRKRKVLDHQMTKFLGGKRATDLFLFLSYVVLLRISIFLLVFNLLLKKLRCQILYRYVNKMSVKLKVKWIPHGRDCLKCHTFNCLRWKHNLLKQGKTWQCSSTCAKLRLPSRHCPKVKLQQKSCSPRFLLLRSLVRKSIPQEKGVSLCK